MRIPTFQDNKNKTKQNSIHLKMLFCINKFMLWISVEDHKHIHPWISTNKPIAYFTKNRFLCYTSSIFTYFSFWILEYNQKFLHQNCFLIEYGLASFLTLLHTFRNLFLIVLAINLKIKFFESLSFR